MGDAVERGHLTGEVLVERVIVLAVERYEHVGGPGGGGGVGALVVGAEGRI